MVIKTVVIRGLLLLLTLSILTSCREKNEGEVLRIAIASNLQYAVDSLVAGFQRKYDVSCEVIPGSSGKLFAQIREGAPYDLFLSADLTYPESLYMAGKTSEQPEVFASGSLVLWTIDPEISPSIAILAQDEIRYIAMGNPKIAPFGRAALEALEFYDLDDRIRDKLVYGESVSQVNQFIESGSADIGFTSLAIVRNTELRRRGKWVLVDPRAYNPLPHGVVIIKNGGSGKPAAKDFYQYLFSPEGKVILKNFGYSVHE